MRVWLFIQYKLLWVHVLLDWVLHSLNFTEVAEELCKTASSGHSGPLQSFSHDTPQLPFKSRTPHKHTENKENIEGGLDGRADLATHGHSGTARHAYLTTNQSSEPHYDSAGMSEDTDSEIHLQRRQARRLRRRAVIFLSNWHTRQSTNAFLQLFRAFVKLWITKYYKVFDK